MTVWTHLTRDHTSTRNTSKASPKTSKTSSTPPPTSGTSRFSAESTPTVCPPPGLRLQCPQAFGAGLSINHPRNGDLRRWSTHFASRTFTLRMSTLLLAVATCATAFSGETRTWTDKTGNSITAELIAVQDGNVVLRQADGSQLTVPIKQLSPADREFVEGKPAHGTKRASKRPDAAIAEIAEQFFTELRSEKREVAGESLTKKAQEPREGRQVAARRPARARRRQSLDPRRPCQARRQSGRDSRASPRRRPDAQNQAPPPPGRRPVADLRDERDVSRRREVDQLRSRSRQGRGGRSARRARRQTVRIRRHDARRQAARPRRATRARSCSSTSGRPGADHAARKCPTCSPTIRSTSTMAST